MRGSTCVVVAVASALVACTAPAARADGPDDLAKAVEAGDYEGVRRALAAGAPVDSTHGPQREPVLRIPVGSGNAEMLELLLSKGADVNVRDDTGRTALVALLQAGTMDAPTSRKTFAILMTAGADPNIPYEYPNGVFVDGVPQGYVRGTAVGLAADQKDPEVLAALIAAGACVSTPHLEQPPLHWVLSQSWADADDPRVAKCLEVLLDAGADVNQRAFSNELPRARTALMVAAQRGAVEAIRLLCRRGARVDLRDTDGETALMKAVERCSWEPIAVLLEAGADPTIPDRAGRTCLELAKGIADEDVRQRTIAALEAAVAKRRTAPATSPATAPASGPAPATQPAGAARNRAAVVVPVPTARP